MVQVKQYTRYRNGNSHKVKSHKRKSRKKTGNYNIIRKRQLPKHKKANIFYDMSIKAKKPGKRKSSSGNIYYERRFNRSDSDAYI